MSKQDVENLLARYLSGDASDEEKQQVEAWLEQSGGTNAEWEQLGDAGQAQWLDGLYADIREQIGTGATVIPIKTKPRTWPRIAIAAAVLLVCLSAYFVANYRAGTLSQGQLVSLKTSANQKKQMVLPDSSQVWVNEGSEVKYPKSFDGKTREVYLHGEAYFDIHHDAAKPFLIHTGDVVTTVLGTAFNIKENPHSHVVTVTVTRGKVSVSQGNKVLGILTPDQQLTFNVQDQQVKQQQVDAGQAIAWQQAEMHFEDISFADAAAALEKRFNKHIIFSNDRIKRCRFTGTSLAGKNLDQVLKVICAFNNATYKKNADGTIVIDGPGCD